MPLLICAQTGESITLKRQLAHSGEGAVWTTANANKIVKIYHHPSRHRQEKLRVMIQNPPVNPYAQQSFSPFAWPESLIQTKTGEVVGFTMPYIQGGRELIDVYNPSRRKRQGIEVDWRFLHVAAHNIAVVIDSIHAKNYILGDIKPQNILINNQGIPSIIDTDSFQVRNPDSDEVYRCLVGSEGFTPPELIGTNFAQITQTVMHDRFRLGVIIYQLLTGNHPFQGRWQGSGEPPNQTELIKRGQWVFHPQSQLCPSPLTIPLTVLHPALQHNIQQCFTQGSINPAARPSARDWQVALTQAMSSLKTCSQVASHYYSQHHTTCFWCDRHQSLGVDIFSPPRKSKSTRIPPKSPPTSAYPLGAKLKPAPFPIIRDRLKQGSSHFSASLPSLPSARSPRPNQASTAPKRQKLSFLVALFSLSVIGSGIMIALILDGRPHSLYTNKNQLPLSPHQRRSSPLAHDNDKDLQQAVPALTQLAQLNYLQGNFSTALNHLERVIATNPSWAEAYYYRGLVYQTLGRHQEAKLDWQLAERLAPDKMPFNPMFTALELALPSSTGGKQSLKTEERTAPSPGTEQFANLQLPSPSGTLSGYSLPLKSAKQGTPTTPSIKISQKLTNISDYLAKFSPSRTPQTSLGLDPSPNPLPSPRLPQPSNALNHQQTANTLVESTHGNETSTLLANATYQLGLNFASSGSTDRAILTLQRAATLYYDLGQTQTATAIDKTWTQLQEESQQFESVLQTPSFTLGEPEWLFDLGETQLNLD